MQYNIFFVHVTEPPSSDLSCIRHIVQPWTSLLKSLFYLQKRNHNLV